MRPLPCSPDRRDFLRLSLGAGLALGLGLERLFAQEDPRPRTRRRAAAPAGKAEHCILLWMGGGMSQTDTFDPKPGSASAGPLRAIRTARKGVEVSELLPRLAGRMDQVALVRSMATREGAHDRARYLLHTGYAPNGTVRHPDLGALTVKGLPAPELDLPPYVAINGGAVGPGLLGVEHAPFVVADPTRPVADLAYPQGVDGARFDRRRRLLEAIERRFRGQHPGDETRGHTSVYEKADRLMHSAQVKAFDLAAEPAALRDAYGRHRFGQGCLMARRLVETGVRVVEVHLDGWDTHQDNFTRNRALADQLDQGFAALLEDLTARELLARTLVVCLTEFGRTPAINATEGRDHFASGWSTALAGGPIRGGAVIGATSEDGARVVDRPVTAPSFVKTIGAALGLDLAATNYTREGRPIQAFDPEAEVIEELLGA